MAPMIDLAQTSLPRWAYDPMIESADPDGRRFTILAVGPDCEEVLAGWAVATAGRATSVHRCTDATEAVAALEADLTTALVGHRVLVAGTAQDCLTVRAAAVRAGLADDELAVGVIGIPERTVCCVHCAATTTTGEPLDGVVACSGCARNLVVYAHVSRRTGHHLGFMVDAEEQAWRPPA